MFQVISFTMVNFMQYVVRHTPTVLVAIVLATRILVTYQMDYIIHSMPNKAVDAVTNTKYSVMESSTLAQGMTMTDCFEGCLANCLCVAFQICGRNCSYLKEYETTYLATGILQDSPGCTFYDFERKITETREQRCSQGRCLRFVNCCLKSKPCGQHGGQCLPVFEPHPTKRFKCQCAGNGYHGKTCSNPPRSCRAFRIGGFAPKPGKYEIVDKDNNPYTVFCDFDDKGAWTLVQSYPLSASRYFPSYVEDRTIYDNNWNAFRLSKAKMTTIQNSSPKWRMTCNYKTNHVYDSDYVIGKKDEVNILKTITPQCYQVEELKVQGQYCSNCTAYMEQTGTVRFHLQIYGKCEFDEIWFAKMGTQATNPNITLFGMPDPIVVNFHHDCANSSSATTQTWFGF